MNTPFKTLSDDVSTLAHEAAQATERTLRSMQWETQQGMDRVADELADARAQTSITIKQLTREAELLRQRAMDSARESSHQLRERSAHMRDATTTYIQHEPVRSMLMAAAVGAALMGLVALFGRGGDRRH